MKKTFSILTGITPSGSGETHIGNYFGTVVNFLELQKKADKVYFFIADLHALTTIHNRQELQRNVENQILSYLACGLDPQKVIFYRQSDIGLHPELQCILNNVTPLSLIKRCHAYKDKLQKGFDEEKVNMGLFNYPILMAADILMYEADYVPVGDDQRQHIEIARDIAGYFNQAFGQTFKLPDIYNVKATARLIGTDGTRKMSKSLNNYISVFESEEKIKKQIMGCFTDPKRIRPTDPGRVEGNPIFIYHDLVNEDKKEVADLKERYKAGRVGDVEVKEKLLKALLKRFTTERKRYQELQNNPGEIVAILKDGAKKAREQAEKKMMEVREKIGITNKYSFCWQKNQLWRG
jgi:tryptophanyl-tRNA synthetase